MKITKRSNGYYQINLYLGKDANGKPIRKTVYGKTQKEATAKANELKEKYQKGIDLDAVKDSFQAWTERFLLLKKAKVSAAQYSLVKTRAETICSFLGSREIGRLTVADIQYMLNSLAENNPTTNAPSAKSTLKSYKQITQQIFRAAIQSRAIDYNPADFAEIPQNAPSETRRALSDDEILLIKETPHRAQAAALLMLYTGLRRGEVSALMWSDINFSERTLTVSKSVTYKGDDPGSVKAPKTAAGKRTVPIPDELLHFLQQLPKKSLLVVTSASGQQMTETAWTRMWQSYMKTLNAALYSRISGEAVSKFNPNGVPNVLREFTPHCLRHTYATMLYESGVDALVAKELMGHSDIKTTLGVYTHLSTKHAAISADKLNAYLSSRHTSAAEA